MIQRREWIYFLTAVVCLVPGPACLGLAVVSAALEQPLALLVLVTVSLSLPALPVTLPPTAALSTPAGHVQALHLLPG